MVLVGLGPRQSRFTCHLNMLILFKNRISVSAQYWPNKSRFWGRTRAVFKFLPCLSIHAQTIRCGNNIHGKSILYFADFFGSGRFSHSTSKVIRFAITKEMYLFGVHYLLVQNRLNFCLYSAETEICACFQQKRHVKKQNNVDRNCPRTQHNIYHLAEPPSFSLCTSFYSYICTFFYKL
jgi:hypothetical protein